MRGKVGRDREHFVVAARNESKILAAPPAVIALNVRVPQPIQLIRERRDSYLTPEVSVVMQSFGQGSIHYRTFSELSSTTTSRTFVARWGGRRRKVEITAGTRGRRGRNDNRTPATRAGVSIRRFCATTTRTNCGQQANAGNQGQKQLLQDNLQSACVGLPGAGWGPVTRRIRSRETVGQGYRQNRGCFSPVHSLYHRLG